jgi:hypothetical protein
VGTLWEITYFICFLVIKGKVRLAKYKFGTMNLFWKAYARRDRRETIENIRMAVSLYGSIVDAKPFSDISLTLVIEVEERRIEELYQALESQLVLDAYGLSGMDSEREVVVYLNVNFPLATGDLRHETPAFPG